MRVNTNQWNRVRYSFYAPVYDAMAILFRRKREVSVALLEVKAGHKVLIVGAGTGLDLDFLPSGCEIVATDITPAMVARIVRRAQRLKMSVKALVMDGQALEFADNTFDKVILHLILSVLPDPVACLREVERVMKPGGEVVVFDKFVPQGESVSPMRRFANLFLNLFFTDITRRFEEIAETTRLTLLSDTNAGLRGNFRYIKLQKNQPIQK